MEMQVFNSMRREKVAEGTLVDRKSKFIALLTGVDSPDAAKSFCETVSADNPAARHVVYAWRILDANDAIQERSTDDGEPSQTAGLPLLEVLRTQALVNVCVCVVRYFGGVLLGPGGLKRAYSGSVKDALKTAEAKHLLTKISKQSAFTTTLSYKNMKTFEHLLMAQGGTIQNTSYQDDVTLCCTVPSQLAASFKSSLEDAFHGDVVLDAAGDSYGVVHDE